MIPFYIKFLFCQQLYLLWKNEKNRGTIQRVRKMDAEEMMLQYRSQNNLAPMPFEAWCFGANADLLAELVLQGRKTATSSLYELYLHEQEPLPQTGQCNVILNSRGEAVCVIRTTAVYVSAFNKVAPFHAAKEGEGDGSLAYWRAEHEAFFTKELNAIGKEFTKTVPVVCEEFELIYPKGG